MRILAGRCQLIGDMVCALPVVTFFRKKYPDAQIIWPIAKKCSQAAPLYINHPDIDTIFVFDGQDGPESERDFALINSCDIKIDPNPNHPDSKYPRERNIYLETFLMAGLTQEDYESLTEEEKIPRLYKWWNEEKPCDRIAFFPQAGYGVENKRNMSVGRNQSLINRLSSFGLIVDQFGHPKDERLDNTWDFRRESYFEQIKTALRYKLIIGTDSGSGLILGAYGARQISLLTDHWGNPNNPMALSTNNLNNITLFAPGGCDNIEENLIIETVLKLLEK